MPKYKAIKVNGVKHDYHRWLMEQELGRKLDTSEIVHHINENSLDNSIENLCVMSNEDHSRLHSKPPYFSELARERRRAKSSEEPAHNRKLTQEDIEYIKKHYTPRDKNHGARALARIYEIDHTSILKIIRGEFYKNF